MAEEKKICPKFDNPPIIETVLGVQFTALQGLPSVQLVSFWKTCLGTSEWKKLAEAMPLLDQFETFEENPKGQGVQFMFGAPPLRLQISQENGGRMIQIQQTRFHYNWNRVGGPYPGYSSIRAEFDRYFEKFREFAAENGLGDIVPNQWEVSYINSIPKGALWQTPSNWCEVLPGLFGRPPSGANVQLESFGGEWHFEIPPKRGRLHISAQLARLKDEPSPVLLFQTTARGSIAAGATTLAEGLEIGHRVTVDTFLGITSDKAQKVWGRKSE